MVKTKSSDKGCFSSLKKRFFKKKDNFDDYISESDANTSGKTEEDYEAKDDYPYKGERYMWLNIIMVIVLSVCVVY